MDLRLKEKVILVTGGAKGVGAAIVRACAKEGAIPVIIDADVAAGEKLQLELRKRGAACGLLSVDLSTTEICEQIVKESVKALGQIDALINNAGVNANVGLENGSPAEFVASLDIDLMPYYSMAHFALPHLKRSKGVILNIGPKLAGDTGTSGYACAKGGVLALTREWAAELLPFGIRVNAVIPTKKRMANPEEAAAMTVFLLSAESSHTTGQHIFVSGGDVRLDGVQG